MSQQDKWERLAAWTGAVFAVVLLVRTLITPKVPLESGPEGVATFFVERQFVWLLSVFLTGIIVVAGTWFYGSLRVHLDRAGEGRLATIMFGSWVMVGAIALIRHAFIAAPTIAALRFEITGLLLIIGGIMLSMVWVAAFSATLALTIAAARSDALPQWFVGLSALFAVVLLGGAATLLSAGGYFSPFGDYKEVVLYSYVVWAAAGSFALHGRLTASSSQGSTAPPLSDEDADA